MLQQWVQSSPFCKALYAAKLVSGLSVFRLPLDNRILVTPTPKIRIL